MKRAAEVPTSSIHIDMETVPNDLSILRKPIKTSVNGLNEARKAYEDGTDEVSEMLIYSALSSLLFHSIFSKLLCRLGT